MKKQYKALMLDMDGTTIPNKEKGLPSQIVCEAIALAQKKLHVAAVSGRPYALVKPIAQVLSLSGPSIVSSGSQIVDMATGDVLWEKTLSDQEGRKIFQLLKDFGAGDILMQRVGEEGGFYASMGESDTRDVLTIAVQVREEIHDDVVNILKQFSDIAVHQMPGWDKGHKWLAISHVEATKQHGIYEVAKLLQIETHEIIGIGDGYNDFPLLMACGLKVAMGNAVPELKEIADYVAPTVDDDGVADVIKKFIL